MTMRIEPEYAVKKCIYENLPWDFLQDQDEYKTLLNSYDFMSLFTTYKSPRMNSAWFGEKVSVEFYEENKGKNLCEPDFRGAKLVDRISLQPN